MTIPSKTSSTPLILPRISAACARLLLEKRLVFAEDLQVDRLGNAAGQVSDVVFDELAEVRVDRRLRGGDPRSRMSSITSSIGRRWRRGFRRMT